MWQSAFARGAVLSSRHAMGSETMALSNYSLERTVNDKVPVVRRRRAAAQLGR